MKHVHTLSLIVPSGSTRHLSPHVVASPTLTNPWEQSCPCTTTTALSAMSLPVATVTSLAPSKGFFQILTAFIAGGIFFSSALAGVAAVAAIGKENLQLLWHITNVVLQKVWGVFKVGITETKGILRMDGKWKFREAWKRLKATLLETRKIAAEGVSALRDEAQLYYGAVGGPGLLPIQYALDRLMPYTISIALKDALEDALSNVKNDNIRSIKLLDFDSGAVAPQLKGARIYDLKEDALAYDVDLEWKSELYAKLNLVMKRIGLKIPATLKNVNFQGTVRIEIVPFIKEPPGYGAILVSFPSPPKLGLDISVAGGEITKVPWLRSELLGELQRSIEQELLWPNRIVIPASEKIPKGVINQLLKTDPLLQAEQRLSEKPMLREFARQPDKKSLRSMLKVIVGKD